MHGLETFGLSSGECQDGGVKALADPTEPLAACVAGIMLGTAGSVWHGLFIL
jgi:hypothetical protein